ncbi:uncharacterized protein N7529_009628 [Penicillium soppii]|uniref:uncharacterized protein n=1 Tax=Penicillium soppii TaxID=69789 RepID=UPI0025493AC2|nr:uncharacterized protein N7529_009628 [Penicillium soppii]KAJ5855684.1 hypothetical protein N7529_009628 [Penicillium soppii]
MSIDTPAKDTSVSTPSSKEGNPGTKESEKATETPTSNYSANLLSSLLSPFSFSKETPKETSEKSKTHILIGPTNQKPEQYYAPEETPLFKKLQKSRLTRTRTKQLLRAAEREYNDPPPPPGLGDCCGSSCDPCVRDLWKEEIGIWRERWGDWAEEDEKDGKEAKKEVRNEEEKPKKKELEW